MISLPRRSASSTIAAPGVAGADDTLGGSDAVRGGDRASLVEQLVGLLELLAQIGVERELERHDDDAEQHDPARALGGEPGRDLDGLPGRVASDDRHEDRAVLEREGRPERNRRARGRA